MSLETRIHLGYHYHDQAINASIISRIICLFLTLFSSMLIRDSLTPFLGLQGDPTSPFWRRSALGFLWREWCWSWSSSTLATWCEDLTHWKRPWCWEKLKAGGGGDNRGWDGWMASPTQWTWVWASPRSWWWTGRPGMLQSMGLQRVGHNWATELNWTEKIYSQLRPGTTE